MSPGLLACNLQQKYGVRSKANTVHMIYDTVLDVVVAAATTAAAVVADVAVAAYTYYYFVVVVFGLLQMLLLLCNLYLI